MTLFGLGGGVGDTGSYFLDSLSTSGTANTIVAHAKSKNFNQWHIFNDSDTMIKFRLPDGSSEDFIEVLANSDIEFRLAATGYDEQSAGTSKAFRVFAIE